VTIVPERSSLGAGAVGLGVGVGVGTGATAVGAEPVAGGTG
jgi:hypothetical protein